MPWERRVGVLDSNEVPWFAQQRDDPKANKCIFVTPLMRLPAPYCITEAQDCCCSLEFKYNSSDGLGESKQ